MIKRFVIAFVLLALVGGGIVGFNLFRASMIEQFFANRPVPALTVSTVTVEPSRWTPGIDAIGTVGASRGVDLTMETSGIVKQVSFSANERVEQGKVLVQLDDAVQRADLEATRAQAKLDAQSLERISTLESRGVSAAASMDSARAAASASVSQVNKLEAMLDQRQLRAPFSGTLGIPRVEVGEYVSPGDAVATLQDLDTMRVDFSVPEQQLDLLQLGLPVAFGRTAEDMRYRGRITGIEPKVDPVSRLVSVRASIDNPEGRLRPGQFVQVRVELPEEAGVLTVLQTALVASLYGDYVYIVRPAEDAEAALASEGKATGGESEPSLKAVQAFVDVGRRNQGRVEITGGIEAGDRVISAGQNRLFNGAPVKIDNSIDPAKAATQAAAE